MLINAKSSATQLQQLSWGKSPTIPTEPIFNMVIKCIQKTPPILRGRECLMCSLFFNVIYKKYFLIHVWSLIWVTYLIVCVHVRVCVCMSEWVWIGACMQAFVSHIHTSVIHITSTRSWRLLNAASKTIPSGVSSETRYVAQQKWKWHRFWQQSFQYTGVSHIYIFQAKILSANQNTCH